MSFLSLTAQAMGLGVYLGIFPIPQNTENLKITLVSFSRALKMKRKF